MTVTPMFLVGMEIIAIVLGFLISLIIGKIEEKARNSKGNKKNWKKIEKGIDIVGTLWYNIVKRKEVNNMPYENTLALLIAIRKYADKTTDVEEIKKFVDILVASMTDTKKIEEIAEQFAKIVRDSEKK